MAEGSASGIIFLITVITSLGCGGRQDDFPSAGVGLGVSRHQPAAFFTMKGAIYFQDTSAYIEVRPHETADLTPTQASGEFQQKKFITVILFGLD